MSCRSGRDSSWSKIDHRAARCLALGAQKGSSTFAAGGELTHGPQTINPLDRRRRSRSRRSRSRRRRPWLRRVSSSCGRSAHVPKTSIATFTRAARRDWNAWTADRRDRDYRAEPARANGELSSNLELVERLLASYRRTFKKAHYGSMWGTIFEQNHLPIHQVFMAGTVAEAERILRDPANTELHHGFDTTVADFTKRLIASEATSRVWPKRAR